MKNLLLMIVVGLLLFWVADVPAAEFGRVVNSHLSVVELSYDDAEDLSQIKQSLDIWEADLDNQTIETALTQAEIETLTEQGFKIEVDEKRTQNIRRIVSPEDAALPGIPGFPCYRTVEETFATAVQLTADHPTLAQWIDVGDSWEKTQDATAGYDLQVLVLGNQANTTPDKPKLFAISALHAREYTTAELMTRFAEYLINNYGTDADATWILDHHEIHLMLQANPDGRKQAETGRLWRKNTNQNYCGTASNNRGVDLNRNFPFDWGAHNGSSPNECDETYRGPSAASEPEVQAITSYMKSIFPDKRGDQPTDAAPLDTSGIFLDVHSYSELVIWSWGGVNTPTPNSTGLTTLGRKLAYFNDYTPEQAIGLYPTDGTTDDYGYGELGVPSFTYELGTDFFESCGIFENAILPDNLASLLYAAKVVRTPYVTPAGPDITTPALSANNIVAGVTVNVSATADDTRYNNVNGTEPSQIISAAELYIDTPPWEGGTPSTMNAADGNFDTHSETVFTTIDTTDLSIGNHIIYMRGQDTDGNWGAFSATYLTIVDPQITPTVTPQPTATPPPPTPDANGVIRWCADDVLVIPDNDTDISTLTTYDDRPISDLDILIDVSHAFIGDLTFELTHDDTGTSVDLFAMDSGCTGGGLAVTLDDDAAVTITSQCDTLLSGTFQPAASLSAFNDQLLLGQWSLSVTDRADFDAGTVDQWCLLASSNFVPLTVGMNDTAEPTLSSNWLLILLLPIITITMMVLYRRQHSVTHL